MIMSNNKKQQANMIVEKFGMPKDEMGKKSNAMAFDVMAAEPEAEVDEGLMAAAEDIQSAIMSKSPADLAKALTAFYDMYEASPEDVAEDSEEPKLDILG